MDKRRRLSESQQIIPNGIFGMIFFISTEIMFFSGLISAFVVNRAEKPGAWEAPWQNVLPLEQTQFNTFILFVSAIMMAMSTWSIYKNKDLKQTRLFLAITLILGTTFVILQGKEWISLIEYGLTTGSSIFGAFFYIIIGAHGLHVIAGILILMYLFRKMSFEAVPFKKKAFSILVGSLYWYYVGLLWPVLYYLVYLS